MSNQALYRLAAERADTSDPLVRQEMAAIETGYRIGRILVMREVLRQAPAGFSAATKCFCTEHEWRVAEFVARMLGAEATLWNDVTRGLIYAPGYTIMGGTSNIMRNILGERVLGLPASPADRRPQTLVSSGGTSAGSGGGEPSPDVWTSSQPTVYAVIDSEPMA